MKIILTTIGRIVRITTAIALIIISLWALLLPPLFPASSRALVNAKIAEIEMPISGTIKTVAHKEKARVVADSFLATIVRNQEAIKKEHDHLLFERVKINDEVKAIDKNIAVIAVELKRLNAEMIKFRTESKQTLALQQKKKVAQLKADRIAYQIKLSKQTKLKPLYDEGIITLAQWSKATDATLLAQQALHVSEAELTLLQNKIKQMDNEVVMVGRYGNEMILSEIGRMKQESRNLNMRRIILNSELAEINKKISTSELSLDKNESVDLASPVDGLLWRQNIIPGQTIFKGAKILEVADKNTLFIEAYFGRQFLDSISLGDKAHVYLISDAKFYVGRVVEIQAQEQDRARSMAINSVAPDATMLKLIIAMDENEVTIAQLGQLAKVMISSANPTIVERTMVWLSFMLRSQT